MADDLDPFEDLFDDKPQKNARAAGKFLFKPKLNPQKKATAKSSVPSAQAIQTVHSAPHVLSEPVETRKSLECSSDVLPNRNDKIDSQAFDGTPVEENDDALIGSEPNADILLNINTDAVTFASNTENIEGRLGTQVLSSIDASTNTCKADVPKYPCPPEDLVVSSTDLHNDKDNRQGTEEVDVMDSINATEFPTESGQRTNFPPEINTCEASETTLYQTGPIQQDNAEKDLSPTTQLDDVIDLLSLGTRSLPTESTSELRLNQEPMNLLEVPQLDSCTHMEGLPEMPAKLASRRAKTGNSKNNATPDLHSEQQKASTSSKENESGRSLRSKNGKMNICDLVDEMIAAGEFSEEHLFNSAIDEENINGEQPQVEDESQKKNLKRKLKKTKNDKEKPPRNSKKAKETSEQETHAKQKRFSHSTRRRRVNKNLLDIPEEEFDPREVLLRDLILLGEHRERQMKTGNAAGAQETQQSAGNSAGFHNDEANNYASDKNGEREAPAAKDTTEYFNYHSRMYRIPRVKWSKRDTELFYGAVKQFGTDFTMIAQLFPGRSREQIRNKFKKEERQQPLMLREALTTRSKDHSYFEKVIHDLKQLRAKEEKEEDLEDLSYQEGTANPNDDDQAKHDYVEEEVNEGMANDSTDVRNSPVKGEKQQEEEDFHQEEEEVEEEDIWSQYKSAI